MRRIIIYLFIALLIFLVIGLWMIRSGWQGRSVLNGFVEPFAQVASFASNLWPGSGGELQTSVAEDADVQLQHLRTRLQMATRENAELRRLLELPVPDEWTFVHARILARDPVTWNRRFRINRGRVDGLLEGQAVLQDAVLIGRVTEVDNRTALVTTILDPSCKVSVLIEGNGAVGILNGRNKPRNGASCLIKYLPTDKNYRAGMRVSTSGLGQMIPSGLEIGRLLPPAEEDGAGLYRELHVTPAASFSHRPFVSILVLQKTPAEH